MTELLPPPAISEEWTHGAPLFGASGKNFDLKDLVAVVRRRLPLVIGALVGICVIGTVVTLSLTPQYTGTSAVLYDSESAGAVDLKDILEESGQTPVTIANQVEILSSSAFLGKIVDKLQLVDDPEFNRAALGSGLRSWINRLINRPALASSDEERTRERNNAIDALRQHITAKVRVGTSVIEIGVLSASAEKAAGLANALADGYVTDQLEARYESAQVVNAWLSDRLGGLKTKVQQADGAAASYAAANHLQPINQGGETLLNQRIEDINSNLSKAKADLLDKQERYQRAVSLQKSGGNVGSIPGATTSTTLQTLQNQRADLVRQHDEMSTRYQDRHPEMIKITNEIQGVDQQIASETARIVEGLREDLTSAQNQVDVLNSSLHELEGQSNDAGAASVHLRELQQTAESARTLYEQFLNKFNEVGQQTSLQATNARVISRSAVPREKSFPRTELFLAGTVALAIFIAALLAFVAEQFDRGLRTREQVEEFLHQHLLASLPLVEPGDLKWDGKVHDPSEVVLTNPLSAYNESFRILKAGLQLSNIDKPPKLILVTSALPNEGKTTVAISLARSLAIAGQKVLLLDADVRRPSIPETLKMKKFDRPGLIQCLSGEAKLEQAIFREESSPLHVLLTGSAVTNPADIFTSEAMKRLLLAAREAYDMVIIDSAPILPVLDTRELARLTDTTLFLSRWEKTPRDASREALRLLLEFHAPIAGVALTMTDRRLQKRYGYYGDAYSYYGKYAQYYS